MTYLKFKLKRKLKNLSAKIIKLQTYPPVKKLLFGLKWYAGRNNKGILIFESKSKRIKRNFRLIDKFFCIINIFTIVLRIEYDPMRTGWIALLCSFNGILSYIVSPHNLSIGQKIINTLNKKLVKTYNGICLNLSNEAMIVHMLENKPCNGSKYARSAGTSALVLKKINSGFIVKLPSKEQILINENSFARIGRVSNIDNKFINFYKAGQKRLLGFKSIVRGVAKNPIDHPHGGGGGKCQVTKFAKIAKNHSTRDVKRKSNNNIVRSRKLSVRKVIVVKLKKLPKKEDR